MERTASETRIAMWGGGLTKDETIAGGGSRCGFVFFQAEVRS